MVGSDLHMSFYEQLEGSARGTSSSYAFPNPAYAKKAIHGCYEHPIRHGTRTGCMSSIVSTSNARTDTEVCQAEAVDLFFSPGFPPTHNFNQFIQLHTGPHQHASASGCFGHNSIVFIPIQPSGTKHNSQTTTTKSSE